VPKHSHIDHVVVLMFENRSFDHLLGHLGHGPLEPITGRDGQRWRRSPTVRGARARRIFCHRTDVTVDPGHGFDDVVPQLTNGQLPLDFDRITMGGFAQNYAQCLVDKEQCPSLARDHGHTADQVPALSTLAREFAVCSHWFCSVPSETWPNRLFAHAAQPDALLRNVVKDYKHPTTFSALSKKKISWAVYAGDIPQAASCFHLVDACKDRFNTLEEFFEDVRDNTLPAYSFLEPRHFLRGDDQHPTHSVILGDQLLRSVYDALAAIMGYGSRCSSS
jgi:phospholipase C